MRVWLVTFIFLFGAVQLYQWLKGFMLPLPIYVLAGAFLAVASNSDKGIGSLFSQPPSVDEQLSQTATLAEPINLPETKNPDSPALPPDLKD
jgi:hypothetical protein